MGPRIREDNGRGRGWIPAGVFTWAGSAGEGTGRGEGFIPAAGPPVLSDCYSWR